MFDCDGGGWNVIGVLISFGSCFEFVLFFFWWVDEVFFLFRLKLIGKN